MRHLTKIPQYHICATAPLRLKPSNSVKKECDFGSFLVNTLVLGGCKCCNIKKTPISLPNIWSFLEIVDSRAESPYPFSALINIQYQDLAVLILILNIVQSWYSVLFKSRLYTLLGSSRASKQPLFRDRSLTTIVTFVILGVVSQILATLWILPRPPKPLVLHSLL